MACGTFFYEYAILFLVIFILGNYILKGFKFTKENRNYRIIKVKLDPENEKELKKFFLEHNLKEKLVSSSSFIHDKKQFLDQVYEINFLSDKNYEEFIKSINTKKIEYNILLGEPNSGF